MRKNSSKYAFYLGIIAIALGIIANKWFIEIFFTSDGYIGSLRTVFSICITQMILIGIGIYLIKKKPKISVPENKEFALIAVSIFISFIVVEVTLRIWINYFSTQDQYSKYCLYTDIPPEHYQSSPHHYLNYFPTPNYNKNLTSHNSLGYRSREFNLQPPSKMYRIVILGGSTTYTSSVKDNKKTFPYQLERTLRENFGYKNVEVINAGVFGYNSWESLINLQFRVLDIHPDLVIIYHGTNDVHTRLVLPDAYKGDNSGRRKQWHQPTIPFFEHSLLLRVISRKLGITSQVGIGAFINASTFLGPGGDQWKSTKSLAVEILEQNPPIYFQRNLINMASIAKANDVSIAFATWAHSPYFRDYASTEAYQIAFKENNAIVKKVAHLSGAYLFDFASVMTKDKQYWSDGRHVNEEGALLKAKLFASFIWDLGVLNNQDM